MTALNSVTRGSEAGKRQFTIPETCYTIEIPRLLFIQWQHWVMAHSSRSGSKICDKWSVGSSAAAQLLCLSQSARTINVCLGLDVNRTPVTLFKQLSTFSTWGELTQEPFFKFPSTRNLIYKSTLTVFVPEVRSYTGRYCAHLLQVYALLALQPAVMCQLCNLNLLR